jgi:hypothetical protein
MNIICRQLETNSFGCDVSFTRSFASENIAYLFRRADGTGNEILGVLVSDFPWTKHYFYVDRASKALTKGEVHIVPDSVYDVCLPKDLEMSLLKRTKAQIFSPKAKVIFWGKDTSNYFVVYDRLPHARDTIMGAKQYEQPPYLKLTA